MQTDFPDLFDPRAEAQKQIAALQKLRPAFEESSDDGLYHATRVLVRPDRDLPDDPTQGWEEFVDEPTFQHTTFRLTSPLPRAQHLCFHGSKSHLARFTKFAGEIASIIPMQFLPRVSPNPKDWEPRYLRDQWLLGLYRLAYMRKGLIPVKRDIQRNGADGCDGIDRGFFDPLARAGCCDSSQRNGYQTWLQSFDLTGCAPPRFQYASLDRNVWESSLIAINYLVENLESGNSNVEYEFWGHIAAVRYFFPMTDVVVTESDLNDSSKPRRKLDVEFNSYRRRIKRDGFEAISLSLLKSNLLSLLWDADGQIVPFTVLAQAWKPSSTLKEARVHTAISQLQNKLEPLNLRIENERKIGYRLLFPSAGPLPAFPK